MEMVRRIADEIEGYMIELGTDGRLLVLQLDELVAGTGEERRLLVADYVPARPEDRACATAAALAELAGLSADALLDAGAVATVLGLGGAESLDAPVSPHGYRLLARVPRLPSYAADGLIGRFGGLQKLLAASVADLQGVDGVGSSQARGVREELSRLAESSLLERYS
jgi:diadenylate cyclase